MKKDQLRFLALGFFLAAILLTVFQVSGLARTKNIDEKPAPVESSVESAESLVVKESESKPELSSSSEDEEEINASSQESESLESESSQEESVDSEAFVFVVQEGQPTSVVIENLHLTGLIEDPEEVQTYIEENNLANRMQFGLYELSKNMSYQEIISIITIQ